MMMFPALQLSLFQSVLFCHFGNYMLNASGSLNNHGCVNTDLIEKYSSPKQPRHYPVNFMVVR
jgi:hypothetical protein